MVCKVQRKECNRDVGYEVKRLRASDGLKPSDAFALRKALTTPFCFAKFPSSKEVDELS